MDALPLDDRRLLAAASSGSSRAREELFRRHWRAAWRRAFAITGRRASADDVVQDAFERAFRALPDFDGRVPFERWLSRIVTNRAIDLLRADRREVSLDEAAGLAVEWSGGTGREAGVRTAVAGLTPERRAVIVLRYWLGCSPPEIADLLELPLGTVHSRLARALPDLRPLLSEEPDA